MSVDNGYNHNNNDDDDDDDHNGNNDGEDNDNDDRNDNDLVTSFKSFLKFKIEGLFPKWQFAKTTTS